MILIDTSGLLAALDASERSHVAASRTLDDAEPPLLMSPFVLAGLDYLLGRRVGASAQRALLDDVAAGAYALEPMAPADAGAAEAIIERFADLELGLADASVVVLAERHGARDVLTLDRRHFGALRASDGGAFRLLPEEG